MHTTDHPKLTDIQPYPETQDTVSPSLTNEPRADKSNISPPAVEVHIENYKPAANEIPHPNPPSSPVEPTVQVDIPSPAHSISSILNIDSECTLSPEPQTNQSNEPNNPHNKEPKTFKPVKHLPTNRKMVVWGLEIQKKWCILGDSNLARITEHHFENIQIHSYPGATFNHAETLINKAHVQTKVETVILTFGINHRNQKLKETAIKQIQGALRAAREKFPGALIRIPLINFSETLNKQEQAILEGINDHVQKNMPYLRKLPSAQFQVTSDGIHWTPTCAKAMLQHWTEQLNYPAL
ncbi:proteoglycan 4-like protein [Clarias magur]|uniref:Proteoglycan 4-like protein n=1 Tax=Clarias magur TaxID=1594786 RepID=A0A8J4WYL6_CLAMG|nr:proteoglycan 4-like protein [Clarias magur]